MERRAAFVDIHCHLLPELDDGASNWNESLEMARMAVEDGFTHAIVTPHQLGAYRENTGKRIRQQATEFRRRLLEAQIELNIAVGGDVRIEPDIVKQLNDGQVLSLADQGRHVLLELPHELYFPLEPLLTSLDRNGYTGILSHPERNHGILADPRILRGLVAAGCLMQLTASSLVGAFGTASAQLSEFMLREGLVHAIATDAHGVRTRRPKISHAFDRVVQLVGEEMAYELCCHNPRRIFAGEAVSVGGRRSIRRQRRWFGFARSS